MARGQATKASIAAIPTSVFKLRLTRRAREKLMGWGRGSLIVLAYFQRRLSTTFRVRNKNNSVVLT
jgi:hypothetical protein